MRPADPSGIAPLVQIVVGLGSCLVGFGLWFGCGAGGQLTPVMRCQLDALKILPSDPKMVTPYDAVDLWHRVRDCKRAEADGGS